MKKGTLLIVEDHKNVLKALVQLLEPEFGSVFSLTNPNLIPGQIAENSIDVVLLDMNFSGGLNRGDEGIHWLHKILEHDKDIVVVMITAYGDVELAVKAMKMGATDFILKPWDNEKLLATMTSAYKLRQSRLEIKTLRNKQIHLNRDIEKQYDILIGSSPAMLGVYKTIQKVASTQTNVLLLGENGTGKELIAREIHKQSRRANEIFVSVDMGSLSESLFESEIFGHVKGAFTDAKEDRAGRFEIASGGTLFLDEIGNLSVAMQAKLLAVLQNHTITRLGSNIPVDIDIRLICATNKDLKMLISENLFREDLYYRINTIEIVIPPLRDRGEDTLQLADYFLRRYCEKYDRSPLKLSGKSIDILMKYKWPGNIRELKHTIEKAVILSDSNVLKPEDILFSQLKTPSIPEQKQMALQDIEKHAIKNALENNRGNIARAAKELGLSRQTVYNKIVKYKL
ncbi:MAG: AAA family ATPase [Bacteroides sp. SM23_62_1]|nr:MAG: AAA family ATPase [Bacteroides sp. SM23_62_1]